MKWCLIVIGALTTSVLWGCATDFVSIQSSQLTFLRDRLLETADRGPRPAWGIYWFGEERSVYAINAGREVLFANESGDLLRFRDNQIVEARNLLPGKRNVLIEPVEPGLHYRVNGESVGIHACRIWELERVEKKTGRTSFIQRCVNDEMTYANRFTINQDRQLVRLMYYVHPHYPAVRLELVRGDVPAP